MQYYACFCFSKKNGVTATHISITAGHSCVCTEDVINILQLGPLDIKRASNEVRQRNHITAWKIYDGK